VFGNRVAPIRLSPWSLFHFGLNGESDRHLACRTSWIQHRDLVAAKDFKRPAIENADFDAIGRDHQFMAGVDQNVSPVNAQGDGRLDCD
jgi:hypothetical protein